MRDPREVPLMAEALRLWDGLDARTGRDTGFTRAGIIFACAGREGTGRSRSLASNLQGYQIDNRMLSAGEFGDLFPGSKLDMAGALYTPRMVARSRSAQPRRLPRLPATRVRPFSPNAPCAASNCPLVLSVAW
jgi:hypothetical protein